MNSTGKWRSKSGWEWRGSTSYSGIWASKEPLKSKSPENILHLNNKKNVYLATKIIKINLLWTTRGRNVENRPVKRIMHVYEH